MKTKTKHYVGDTVRIRTDNDNECYLDYCGMDLRVTHKATRYMPAKEFFAAGRPQGYHPGYDASTGCALYDLETLDGTVVPFSLYDWEIA